MQVDGRNRAKLFLAAGMMGMIIQERLSLITGNVTQSAALIVLAASVGALLFAHAAAFRAGYEEARQDKPIARAHTQRRSPSA
jgi:hypothetical protein